MHASSSAFGMCSVVSECTKASSETSVLLDLTTTFPKKFDVEPATRKSSLLSALYHVSFFFFPFFFCVGVERVENATGRSAL